MSKIQCNDYTCKFQNSDGYCTLKNIQLKDKVCQNYEKNIMSYYGFVFQKLADSNFINPQELTPDLRIGLWLVMKTYDLIYVERTYGDWTLLQLVDNQDHERVIKLEDFYGYLKDRFNSDFFEQAQRDFEEGKLPGQNAQSLESYYAEYDEEIEPDVTLDPEYGFLSPSGDYTTADFGEHEVLAHDIIINKGWKEDYFKNNPSLTAADYLVQRGYVLIHCPSLWGRIEVTGGDRPKTKAQREFLYDYFMTLGEKERANEYIKEGE